MKITTSIQGKAECLTLEPTTKEEAFRLGEIFQQLVLLDKDLRIYKLEPMLQIVIARGSNRENPSLITH